MLGSHKLQRTAGTPPPSRPEGKAQGAPSASGAADADAVDLKITADVDPLVSEVLSGPIGSPLAQAQEPVVPRQRLASELAASGQATAEPASAGSAAKPGADRKSSAPGLDTLPPSDTPDFRAADRMMSRELAGNFHKQWEEGLQHLNPAFRLLLPAGGSMVQVMMQTTRICELEPEKMGKMIIQKAGAD